MKIKRLFTLFIEGDLEELEPLDRELVDEAIRASNNAYAPYSDFKVGAAVRLNDVIITGNNQENSAYPSGLCAERVALFYAQSQFPNTPIDSIAIFANSKDVSASCGACRQVMAEYELRHKQAIRIIMTNGKKVRIVNGIKNLLPMIFILEKK